MTIYWNGLQLIMCHIEK